MSPLERTGEPELAEVIAAALFGKTVSATPKVEKLRKRYWKRTGIGSTDTAYQRTISGAGVRGCDLWMINQMQKFFSMSWLCSAYDRRRAVGWAAAQGKNHKVDDGSVLLDWVISNVGGGSRSSNAVKEEAPPI